MKTSKVFLIGCGGTIALVIIILAISFAVYLNSEETPSGESAPSTTISSTTPPSKTPPVTTTITTTTTVSSTTTTQPTATEQPAEEVELLEATNQGLIELSVSGRSTIDEIKVEITSKCNRYLCVIILPGTMFVGGTGIQSMIVTKLKEILLEPGEIKYTYVDAACGNMELDVPSGDDLFELYTGTINTDLKKLLELDGFSEYTFRVKQFAIWTITDNPKRNEYVGIVIGVGWGTGPSDEEIETIKDIFQEAGISLAPYQALR
ncbi:MAG: hypothetical protein JXA17_00760 [Dehalococcoidales bacterium]|nr:hypothetical protein [Dehalococcoidales bacterium]